MKKLYVFLVISTSKGLRSALNSLQQIDEHMESHHIFIDETVNKLDVNNGGNGFFYEVKSGNIGAQFDKALSKLNDGYILFLFEGDVVYSKEIVNFMNGIEAEAKSIITKIIRYKGILLKRPLFIRIDYLKTTNFFRLYRTPFIEALFYYWLQKMNDKEITDVETDSIKHSISTSKSRIQILDFFKKIQYKDEHALKGESSVTLTVVIANYNMADFVESAISSSILQSSKPEKILIIDDGSRDHSLQLIEKYSTEPNVEIFKQKNTGKAKAINAVINMIKTDFILELDADDWLDFDAVYTIKEQLRNLDQDIAVLYGNFRSWKTTGNGGVRYSSVAKGWQVHTHQELVNYRFPLGPRIYRTTALKGVNGFPVIEFENGRLYEDVSVLSRLLATYRFHYHDFTVYNIREHSNSITKKNHPKWSDFIKILTKRYS